MRNHRPGEQIILVLRGEFKARKQRFPHTYSKPFFHNFYAPFDLLVLNFYHSSIPPRSRGCSRSHCSRRRSNSCCFSMIIFWSFLNSPTVMLSRFLPAELGRSPFSMFRRTVFFIIQLYFCASILGIDYF